MILTFAEDFTSSVTLDAQLVGTSESGLYLNRGVLPILTVDNLLSVLPSLDYTFTAWSSLTTYNKFDTTRKRSDIVLYQSKVYQSIADTNLNETPSSSTTYWLETTIESLRIKAWLWTVQDNLLSQLSLHRNLVENQYIYNVGETDVTLSGNFHGWAFEPKGSDYVKIKINQIALQANTDSDVNLYVVNQNTLLTTLVLHPNNGKLEFEELGYTISGKGRFLFLIASQSVKTGSAFNDILKYDGFVCYPVVGIGSTAATSTYSIADTGNGLNFNVSAYTDSSQYVTNNLVHFARAFQSQAEMDFIQMLRFNSNTRTNNIERIIGADKTYLDFQTAEINGNTVARKYSQEIKLAKESIDRTFDRMLKTPKTLTVISDSV